MAILWQYDQAGTHYEVRSAGRTRRLYTDGVFHSQFNSQRILTGSVWDLLMLPAFFRPVGQVKRVLVLGVGGGTVIAQLKAFVEPDHITGIELNPVHIKVARRWFGIKPSMAELIQADAVDWVKNHQGPGFDLVIEDLYGECDGEPSRALAATAGWMRQLGNLLTPQGVLVMNFTTPTELNACAWHSSKPLQRRFPVAYALSTPGYENRVAAFVSRPDEAREFKKRLQDVAAFRSKTQGLRFSCRSLKSHG